MVQRKTRKTTKGRTTRTTARRATTRTAAEEIRRPVSDAGRISEMESSNVDRIRDLIVGPQLRETERRVEIAEKEADRTRKWVEDRMERLEKVLLDNLERVATSTDEANGAIREVASRLEELRKHTELEQRRLQTGTEDLRAEIIKQFGKALDEVRSRIDEVRDESHSSLEQLRQDNLQAIDEIEHAKMGRTEFADYLIEIGLRLKGEDGAKGRR